MSGFLARKPKLITIVAVLLLLIVVFTGCEPSPFDYEIDRSVSYYNTYRVESGLVKIECFIKIANETGNENEFYICADFLEDKTGGLLKETKLYACDEDGNKEKFKIEEGDAKLLNVIFMGKFGGTNKKYNNDLPENIYFEHAS